MAASDGVLVKDLGNLTAETLRSESLIQVKDPENLTDEHVAQLRELVNGLGKSHPIEISALDQRLRSLAKRSSSTSSSRSTLSPTPDTIDFEDLLRQEQNAHHALVRDGGRPSHPYDKVRLDIVDEPGEYANIITYWCGPSRDGTVILRSQWAYWKAFREYQDRVRKLYKNPQTFERHRQFVHQYRQHKDLEGDIHLQGDRKKQSRLDDWKEFQFREYRRADVFVRDMERATEKIRDAERQLLAATSKNAPSDQIDWIKQAGIAYYEAEKGTAELNLERHTALLEWVDQQLSVISSESVASSRHSVETGENASISGRTPLGKRKRCTNDQDHDLSDSHRTGRSRKATTQPSRYQEHISSRTTQRTAKLGRR